MGDSKEKLCTPTPKDKVLRSVNIVFPSIDVQGGRFILDFTVPRKTNFQSNGKYPEIILIEINNSY